MAQGVVTDIAKSLLGKLGSLAVDELYLAWGLEDNLKSLEEKLSAINAVLSDAEKQQSHNERVHLWLQMLQETLYDAEDVLDELECKTLRRKVVKTTRSRSRKVRRLFSSSHSLVFRLRMGHKIKNIMNRLADIASAKSDFNLSEQCNYDQNSPAPRHGETDMSPSFENFTGLIGRDEDRKRIINLLLNTNKIDDANPSVIPIVGIGGLGKTALSKSVCVDESVQNHFEVLVQVCVSDGFDFKQVGAKMIESVTGSKGTDLNINKLQSNLQKILEGKKYLLLLDDVWNEDPRKWLLLKPLLSKGTNGSKIIVTTRSNRVAGIMGTVPAYNLSLLDEDHCLSLFLKCAFKEGQESCTKKKEGQEKQYTHLVKIGEQIVRKCKQIPLAVITLGTQLYGVTEEMEWKSIRDHEIWESAEREGGILPALRISYQRLPPHLKRCFLHCSIFPKDYQFVDLCLVQFWIAQGLIRSSNLEDVEDVGHRYLTELISKSFFQDIKDDSLFGITFKMHDLMHDLALSLFQQECSIITPNNLQISKAARHLSFLDSESFSQAVDVLPNKLHRVRTFMPSVSLEGPSCKTNIDMCLSKFKYLRAMDFDADCEMEELPQRIGSLKHLRYLNFFGIRKLKRLPRSIFKLQNLRALILGLGFEELSKDVRYLISLKFLSLSTKQKLLPEGGIGCLVSLQTLVIGSCENLEYLFPDMQDMESLRKLVIFNCESLISLPSSLKDLTALEILCIGDCKKLDLASMEGEEEEEEELDQLSLQLVLFVRLPAMLALPKQLLQRCANSLRRLHVYQCPNISELPECFRNLTYLKELRIDDCPRLNERCRKEAGQDWPMIAHIPKIILNDIVIQNTSE